MYVLFVVSARGVMRVVVHRRFLVVVRALILAHLFLIPLFFVTLLLRFFLGQHDCGILFDRGVECSGRVARHHRSRHQAEQSGPDQCGQDLVHFHLCFSLAGRLRIPALRAA
jgi:hypothetical protein